MVDNVHRNGVPDPSSHASDCGTKSYNWTDTPPSGPNPGADPYKITGNSITPIDTSATEPTNDVFLLFKPGCEQSTVKFLKNSAGYNNEVYLDDTLIIPDARDASSGETFTAPGVTCRGDTSW